MSVKGGGSLICGMSSKVDLYSLLMHSALWVELERIFTEQMELDLKWGMPYFVALHLKWSGVLIVERRKGLITKDTQKF